MEETEDAPPPEDPHRHAVRHALRLRTDLMPSDGLAAGRVQHARAWLADIYLSFHGCGALGYVENAGARRCAFSGATSFHGEPTERLSAVALSAGLDDPIWPILAQLRGETRFRSHARDGHGWQFDYRIGDTRRSLTASNPVDPRALALERAMLDLAALCCERAPDAASEGFLTQWRRYAGLG
jgi:hypothetical protein